MKKKRVSYRSESPITHPPWNYGCYSKKSNSDSQSSLYSSKSRGSPLKSLNRVPSFKRKENVNNKSSRNQKHLMEDSISEEQFETTFNPNAVKKGSNNAWLESIKEIDWKESKLY